MSDVIRILQACDANDANDKKCVQIDLRTVPKQTYLYRLISGERHIPVKRTEAGAILTSSSFEDLQILQRFLHSGRVESGHTSKCVEILDYYGILTFKTLSYPEEFVINKLEEEWFRTNLYSTCFPDNSNIHDRTFRCIQLTDDILSSFTLMSNVHYLYARRPYSSRPNLSHNLLTQLITKERFHKQEKEDIDTKKLVDHCLLHSFPRLYVKFTDYEQLIGKIKDANQMFLDRDSEFESSLIRENIRKNRGQTTINYKYENDKCNIAGLTIPLNWKNSIESMLKQFRESTFWNLFKGIQDPKPESVTETKQDFWAGVLLAGGSVLNLILDCRLKVDYDLFFYGMTREQANNKIRTCIEYFATRSDVSVFSVFRTQNSITLDIGIGHKHVKVQFILRLYTSISEVLHGFDVDCSCVGFDGTNFYLTERSKFALENMMNFVDFDRMSPTYENRLVKYADRGFSTYVPDFKWTPDITNGVMTYITEKNSFPKWDHNKSYEEQRENRKSAMREFRDRHPPLRGVEILISSYFGYKKSNHYVSDYESRGCGERLNLGNFEFVLNRETDVISYSVQFRFGWGKMYASEYAKIMVDNIFELNPLVLYKSKIKSIAGHTFNDDVFDPVFTGHKFRIPFKLEWKTTLPGEQFTSTFHKLVLEDLSTWYKCRFSKDE